MEEHQLQFFIPQLKEVTKILFLALFKIQLWIAQQIVTNAGEYPIYYEDACEVVQSAGFKVTRKAAGGTTVKTITISAISLGKSQCVTTAFPSFTVTLSEIASVAFSVIITSAENSKTATFTCETGSQTPSCSFSGELAYGVYKIAKTLSSDESRELFVANDEAKLIELKYYGTLGEVEKLQTITSTSQKIYVAFLIQSLLRF